MNLDFTIVVEFLKQNPLIGMAVLFLLMWKNGGQANILDMILNFLKGLFVKPPVPQQLSLASASYVDGDDLCCESDCEVIECMIAVARYCEETGKGDVASQLYDLMPNVLKKADK